MRRMHALDEPWPLCFKQVSKRIRSTDDPIMVQSIRMVGDAKDVLSLGQGSCPCCTL